MTDNETTPELKPCPFCGNKVTLSWQEHPFHISCGQCETSGPIVYMRGDDQEKISMALKLWNTRKETP
jgi:Lar family restriction alleviation protein